MWVCNSPESSFFRISGFIRDDWRTEKQGELRDLMFSQVLLGTATEPVVFSGEEKQQCDHSWHCTATLDTEQLDMESARNRPYSLLHHGYRRASRRDHRSDATMCWGQLFDKWERLRQNETKQNQTKKKTFT